MAKKMGRLNAIFERPRHSFAHDLSRFPPCTEADRRTPAPPSVFRLGISQVCPALSEAWPDIARPQIDSRDRSSHSVAVKDPQSNAISGVVTPGFPQWHQSRFFPDGMRQIIIPYPQGGSLASGQRPKGADIALLRWSISPGGSRCA